MNALDVFHYHTSHYVHDGIRIWSSVTRAKNNLYLHITTMRVKILYICSEAHKTTSVHSEDITSASKYIAISDILYVVLILVASVRQ